jgi:hypothetical protein
MHWIGGRRPFYGISASHACIFDGEIAKFNTASFAGKSSSCFDCLPLVFVIPALQGIHPAKAALPSG